MTTPSEVIAQRLAEWLYSEWDDGAACETAAAAVIAALAETGMTVVPAAGTGAVLLGESARDAAAEALAVCEHGADEFGLGWYRSASEHGFLTGRADAVLAVLEPFVAALVEAARREGAAGALDEASHDGVFVWSDEADQMVEAAHADEQERIAREIEKEGERTLPDRDASGPEMFEHDLMWSVLNGCVRIARGSASPRPASQPTDRTSP